MWRDWWNDSVAVLLLFENNNNNKRPEQEDRNLDLFVGFTDTQSPTAEEIKQKKNREEKAANSSSTGVENRTSLTSILILFFFVNGIRVGPNANYGGANERKIWLAPPLIRSMVETISGRKMMW